VIIKTCNQLCDNSYCGNNVNQNSIIMPDSGLGDYASPEDIGMKDGLLALVKHVFNALSFPGQILAFFAIVLLCWSVFVPTPEKVLLGFVFLFLTLSGYYWARRSSIDPLPPIFPDESPGGRVIVLSQMAFAVLFFVLSSVLGYLWFKLPSVQKFLSIILSKT
jgi:hypothetical protein